MSSTSVASVVAPVEETLDLQIGRLEFEGSLLFNAKGKVRRQTLNGKQYLIADAVFLTPGVHEGSEGPILYTEEGNVANASDWDGKPILVNHPMKDGEFVTARDNPDLVIASGIGEVKNAKGTKDGKLVGQLWFEEEATKKVDMRVYNSLVDGKSIELSTGLLLKRDKAPEGAVHNGVPYIEIAGKRMPDHIAILPDQEGACSIKKGCGVLVNELSNYSSQEEKKSVWRKIGEYLGILNPTPVTNEAVRHSELRQELARQIHKRFEKGPMGATLASYVYTYIEDVFDHKVVFTKNDDLLQLSYSKNNKTGAITLGSEDPVKVRKVVTYKPLDSEAGSGSRVVSNVEPEVKMNREAIIDELVANCDCWKHQGDKEVLNSFSDEKLLKLKESLDNTKRLEAVANAAKQGFESQQEGLKYTFNTSTGKWEGKPVEKKPDPAPVVNQDQKARLTPEEQEDILFARNQKNKMREDTINRLVANVKEENRLTVAQDLATKSLADLQLMEKLLPPVPVQTQDMDYQTPVANFFGIQGGPPPAVTKEEEEPPYAPPVMNFSTEKGPDGVMRTVTSW